MRSETEKIDEGLQLTPKLTPELTIISLSGEVPAPRRPRAHGQPRKGQLRIGQIFAHHGQGTCMIHMISAGGLLAETELAVVPGDEIGMEIRPGHRIAGQIVWTDGTFAGIRFSEWVDVLQLLGNETLEGFPSRDPVPFQALDPAPDKTHRPSPRPALIRRSEPKIDRIA